jgi:hypothetical protein
VKEAIRVFVRIPVAFGRVGGRHRGNPGYEGAGHNLPWEQPERVAQDIVRDIVRRGLVTGDRLHGDRSALVVASRTPLNSAGEAKTAAQDVSGLNGDAGRLAGPNHELERPPRRTSA